MPEYDLMGKPVVNKEDLTPSYLKDIKVDIKVNDDLSDKLLDIREKLENLSSQITDSRRRKEDNKRGNGDNF
jgi:predicted  nucleic acid-binding Zn-ribbon protein